MLDTQPLQALLHGLLDESARQDPLPVDTAQQRKLLRTLMNVRPPKPIDKNLLLLQDHILQDELSHKTVTEADSLPPSALDLRLCLWQGDITTLRCDAVVNAANPALLGCFNPLHNCIDNVIHSASGIQLRLACHAQMEKQATTNLPDTQSLHWDLICLPVLSFTRLALWLETESQPNTAPRWPPATAPA